MPRILILLCLLISTSYARQYSDTFIVKILDKKVRVTAPAKYAPHLGVILENKTLVSQLGKIETSSGKLIAIKRIEPNDSEVIDVKDLQKGEKLYFVPMSPAFQSVELKFGKSSYEIPPKR